MDKCLHIIYENVYIHMIVTNIGVSERSFLLNLVKTS